MSRNARLSVLVTLCIVAVLGAPASAIPINKADVDATLCNMSVKPVEFRFYNNGDLSKAINLFKKSVRACSCVEEKTRTNSARKLPKADILQQVYRDVKSTSGESIKVCVSAEGKFEGYIDAKLSTCAKAKKTREYLPAPELTYAQGDVKKLGTEMRATRSHCAKKNRNGKCALFVARYVFSDGADCHGHEPKVRIFGDR